MNVHIFTLQNGIVLVDSILVRNHYPMTLRSLIASVFAVLVLLSAGRNLNKLRLSSNNVSESKVSLYKGYPFQSLVCVLSESCALIHEDRAIVRIGVTTTECDVNLTAQSTSLSRYPIDTLDPPLG